MIKPLLAATLLFLTTDMQVHAQPYLDIASLRYLNSPDAGVLRRNNTSNHIEYYNASFNLPFILKKDSSIIAFSPFAERWETTVKNVTDFPSHVSSLALPLNFVKPLTKKWGLIVVVVPRWNGDKNAIFTNDFQLGGAFLTTYKSRPGLTWKLGFYYNGDLSGPTFWPLLGIDWRINPRNSIFGILPGGMAYEHKINTWLYWGLLFKGITNTYDAGFVNGGSTARYLRIDDNQLSILTDVYLAKKIVLTLEGGHTFFRQLRLGVQNAAPKYYYKDKMNDNLFFKISLNYRIRL